MQRFCRRLHAWIAIFAMAMSALAPAVSRAMGPDEHGRYLVQLCSAAGVEWVELTADEAAFAVEELRVGAHDTVRGLTTAFTLRNELEHEIRVVVVDDLGESHRLPDEHRARVRANRDFARGKLETSPTR